MVWESGAETADTSRCTGVSTPQGGAYRPAFSLSPARSGFQRRLPLAVTRVACDRFGRPLSDRVPVPTLPAAASSHRN